jgi:hypothetical protein
VRYRLLQRCVVRPADGTGSGDWPGIAYNLSRTGIGLSLLYPLLPGTVLIIEPWGLDGARKLYVRVVRCAPVDFAWFHGCELFEPLSEEELWIWLQATAAERERRAREPVVRLRRVLPRKS